MPLYAKVLRPGGGRPLFECKVNDCGDHCCRCKYMIKQTDGTERQCKLKSCYDIDYCWHHLRKVYDIRIAPSRIASPDGSSIGMGLFARTNKPLPSALLAKLKAGKGTAEERRKYLVFKRTTNMRRPVVIGKYVAENISQVQLDERYDYKGEDGKVHEQTAPYAVTEKLRSGVGRQFDSLCHRNFVSYANDARGTDFKNNAKLKSDLRLIAISNIWQGEEILWDYGVEYWNYDIASIKVVNRIRRKRKKSRKKKPRRKRKR